MLFELVAFGLIASVLATAATQLRKRTVVSSQTQADADQDSDRLVPRLPKTGVGERSAASAFTTTVLLPTLAVGLLGFLYFRGLGPHTPEQQCLGGASLASRLQQAATLRGFSHPIHTSSPDAQKLFDLGLLEEFNFNQPEAAATFRQALRLDPNCSRCWWGVSYALGPGANRAIVESRQLYPSFSPEDFPETQAAAFTALRLTSSAVAADPMSELAQRDLEWAEAAALRFRNGSDRNPARDQAEAEYAVAMEQIGNKHQDADALAIAAEGYMNVSPWEYYLPNGTLKWNGAKAEPLIQAALALEPKHPLAIHLYIHIAEASSGLREAQPSAARAEQPADNFMLDGPWQGMGHLLHMPSHTYARVGRWHDMVVTNVRAFEADAADDAACRIAYTPEHNTDMLIYGAVMSGQLAVALKWSSELEVMQRSIPLAAYGDDSADWTHRPLVLAGFGRWEELLEMAEPPPTARGNCPGPPAHAYSLSVWHYGRALALTAAAQARQAAQSAGDSSRVVVHEEAIAAAAELAKLQAVASAMPEELVSTPGEWPGIYSCDYRNLSTLHALTAQARLAVLNGDLPAAEALLAEGVKTEDGMGYMEPPRQLRPLRHCLAWVLLQQQKHAAAEQVYRDDLVAHPDSGWALLGLSQALQGQERSQAAAQVHERFAEAWKHADVQINSSCPAFEQL